MKIDLGSGELNLIKNSPLRLQGARGVRITCTAGIIWITVDGDAGDTFLQPGEQYTLQCNGLTLLESIDEGKIRIARAQATSALTALIRRFCNWQLALGEVPEKASRTRLA